MVIKKKKNTLEAFLYQDKKGALTLIYKRFT